MYFIWTLRFYLYLMFEDMTDPFGSILGMTSFLVWKEKWEYFGNDVEFVSKIVFGSVFREIGFKWVCFWKVVLSYNP